MSSNESNKRLSLTKQLEIPKFDNPNEEITFLKNKLIENQIEFQEFQESSQELELEYETQIRQLEQKNEDSMNLLHRLEDENEQLKTRYNTYTNDTQHKLNEYQAQIVELTSLNNRLTSYIRELEQSNDDLERARRALAASLEDFEGQLNQQIERNVLLENEVSEKEELECIVQRLKEEARDLRHELIVEKKSANSESAKRKQLLMDSYLSNAQRDASLQCISPNQNVSSNSVDSVANKLDETSINGNQEESSPTTPPSNRDSSNNIDSQTYNGMNETPSKPKTNLVDSTTNPMTPPATSLSSKFSFSSPFTNSESSSILTRSTDTKSQQTSMPSSPILSTPVTLTTSSRISALNIVSDLLRKVGALESKLASTRQ